MIEVDCPVRGCHRPLERGARQWSCPDRHTFDVSRSGYCNLLQPNERRSKHPGDTIEAARARRRLFDRGVGHRFLAEIVALARELGVDGPILDAGCGEGFHLTRLCRELGAEGVGIDISTPAIDLAAKSNPEQTWIVSNVDRRLPVPDRSVGTILSITSRVNRAEFERVLNDAGHLIIATPGVDDLVELRARLLGSGTDLVRVPDIADQDETFTLVRQIESRERIDADGSVLSDFLLSTYRAQRRSQAGIASGLTSLEVTQSRTIRAYRRLT